MTQKTNFFKLGLFVIISFGLGALFLIIFGAGQVFKKEILAETCFNESVQGLSIGSEVKYKGIKIGTVKTITSAARIYKTKSDYVLIIISLEKNISMGQTDGSAAYRMKTAVKDGLTVRLAFKGLTGVAYLETDYTEANAQDHLNISWTPENTYIPSRQSSMKQYGDALNQILDNLAAINLEGITTNIATLLKTLDKKANDFNIENISTLTASLLAELKDTNQKVGKAMESDKIKRLLDDAQASFADIRTIVETAKPPLKSAINDFKAAAQSTKNMTIGLEKQLAPRIDSLSGSLDQLMTSLAATSGLIENMVWLNSDRIKLIIENLETTSENLKQMSRDIKRYPGRLLFQKPPEKIDMEPKK
ncbi:MAG: MlaD family protein [Desulfobacula sp.]|nr:MlaD family protein [Desulfobacula sp.]